jgi:glutamate--cysteine ligase
VTTTCSNQLASAVAGLFDPTANSGLGRVGVEIEHFPLRERLGAYEVVHHSVLLQELALDPGLVSEARVSFEPGGQLEMSPPPAASPRALLKNLAALRERLDTCLSPAGVQLKASGVNRWVSCDAIGLRLTTERYQHMQAHFDAIGPDGRRMMRQTAALQICLDLLPDRAGLEQWRVLNLAGPALAAAFSTPSASDVRQASRMLIWLGVDPSRTGFDGQHLLADLIEGYLSLAQRAQAIPLDTARLDCAPVRMPFAEWIAADGIRPDEKDIRHHLSTLFPPVRPRGHYLEVRYVDSMPWPWAAVPVCVLATLAYEPIARREALRALPDGHAGLLCNWRQSAELGLDDGRLSRAAHDLFEIARAGMRRLPPEYLPDNAGSLLQAYVDRFMGRTRPGGVLACASR